MKTIINKLFKKANKEKYSKYLELIPDFKKEKAQKFTTVVLTLIAIIILALFAINPTLSTIANLQKQLEDAKFVSDRLEQKINNLSVLQTKYNSIQDDLPIIYETVPKNTEAPKITGQLQTLVVNSSMKLVSIQASNIVYSKKGDFYYYTFNITAKGTIENALAFLEKVENMQRVTDVSNISINMSAFDNSLQFNLQGKVFYKE
ncbi:MAG: type 4a pilus biogenesis protein PilO [Candidatus Levybacteria bacterium]|nr:type 4a pilus biogenesis protein PilO [Candidatus Levybacteria bacterium]